MVKDIWKEVRGLSDTELARLLKAYDEYVWQIITENESTPVGIAEFYEYDYQEYWKERTEV